MIKSYKEMREIDVLPFCNTRSAKDDNGKKIEIPYLSWAKCIDLLHDNGAEDVYFDPIESDEGSFVFSSAKTKNKDGRECGNYFVKVLIHIDSLEFVQKYPLMNGSLVVWDDTLTQLRISNAHARAFVKGVAIRTGLGFDLWLDDDQPSKEKEDDLSYHNPLKVKQYIEFLMTERLKKGASEEDIIADMGISKKQFNLVLTSLNNAGYILSKLKK